jgi:hypothetical protein
MVDPLDRFPSFIDAVRARLDAGRLTYGDQSFDRPESELLAELQQECLDLAGWGFVLWTRLERLRARLGALEQTPAGPLEVSATAPVKRMVGAKCGG